MRYWPLNFPRGAATLEGDNDNDNDDDDKGGGQSERSEEDDTGGRKRGRGRKGREGTSKTTCARPGITVRAEVRRRRVPIAVWASRARGSHPRLWAPQN